MVRTGVSMAFGVYSLKEPPASDNHHLGGKYAKDRGKKEVMVWVLYNI